MDPFTRPSCIYHVAPQTSDHGSGGSGILLNGADSAPSKPLYVQRRFRHCHIRSASCEHLKWVHEFVCHEGNIWQPQLCVCVLFFETPKVVDFVGIRLGVQSPIVLVSFERLALHQLTGWGPQQDLPFLSQIKSEIAHEGPVVIPDFCLYIFMQYTTNCPALGKRRPGRERRRANKSTARVVHMSIWLRSQGATETGLAASVRSSRHPRFKLQKKTVDLKP